MTTDKQEEYLLLKMLPEQVSDSWEKFAPLIEKSLPPVVADRRKRMSNVLRAILKEELIVWVYYDSNENERYVTTTQIRTDEISLSKNLLIYSLTGLGKVNPTEITNGIKTLKRYAKGNGCNTIIGYVNDLGIMRLLEQQGADAEFAFLQLEV